MDSRRMVVRCCFYAGIHWVYGFCFCWHRPTRWFEWDTWFVEALAESCGLEVTVLSICVFPLGYLHIFASASSAQSCSICFRDLSTCSVGKCWKSKRRQLSHETIRPALHQRRVPSPHWGLCHGFDFSICRNFIAFVKLGTFLRRHSQSIPKW